MGQIYFVQVKTERSVHMQALGFTNYLPLYGWGATAEEAGECVLAYLAGNDVGGRVITSAPAEEQRLAKFTFPEQINGLPVDVAKAELRSRGYPERIVDEALARLYRRNAQIAEGRAKLAKEASHG